MLMSGTGSNMTRNGERSAAPRARVQPAGPGQPSARSDSRIPARPVAAPCGSARPRRLPRRASSPPGCTGPRNRSMPGCVAAARGQIGRIGGDEMPRPAVAHQDGARRVGHVPHLVRVDGDRVGLAERARSPAPSRRSGQCSPPRSPDLGRARPACRPLSGSRPLRIRRSRRPNGGGR